MADDRSLLDRLNALKPTSVSLDKEEPKLPLSALSTEPTSKEDALSARLRTLWNTSASPSSPPPGLKTQPQLVSDTVGSPLGGSRVPPPVPVHRQVDGEAENEDDPLFHADDRTLDEFLERLDLDDDIALDQPPPLRYDPKEESKRVTALLEELKPSSSDPDRSRDEDDQDDDSDGEEMSAQTRQILSRALDEAELDRQATSPPPKSPTQPKPLTVDPDPFSLPTVPSHLSNPVPAPSPLPSFESSIAARMAALKGVSYGTDPETDTTFGLPQAPSFDPDSRSEPSKPAAGGFAGPLSGGYTDEDQKTWCVVCLEDATVRCEGCDGDVYCGRCWRDMHVGPRAGYDERGHRWVKFERGK